MGLTGVPEPLQDREPCRGRGRVKTGGPGEHRWWGAVLLGSGYKGSRALEMGSSGHQGDRLVMGLQRRGA